MKEKPIGVEKMREVMEGIWTEYPSNGSYVMAADTKDYIAASLKMDGYHNKSKRRRTIRNARKNLDRRVVEGRRNKAGLHHYITGKDK